MEQLAKLPRNKYIEHACENCGKVRRVQLIDIKKGGRPMRMRCRSCANKLRLYSNQNHNWKGGRIKRGRYIAVKLYPDDFFYPMGNGRGYVLEHRLVMAKILGRCLQPWEIVHHKKGIAKNNNRGEGLQLVSDDRHMQITILENKIKRLEEKVKLLQWQIKIQGANITGEGAIAFPYMDLRTRKQLDDLISMR